jgi:(+)-trans-carveol dehydrogenase
MPGKLEGKVALISGAARGQGRSHAVRLAQEGADIIAFDILQKLDYSVAEGATEEDRDETIRQVEALDRRIHFEQADVRDYDAVKRVVDAGVAELGRLDIVSANAGINPEPATADEMPEDSFRGTVDINLVGVWHTAKAAIPHIRAGGRGGSIVLTSSDAGLFAMANIAGYVSAKHGVVGLMRTLALELAPDMIRVNSIHPTVVNTPMVMNEGTYRLFRPDVEHPGKDDMAVAAQAINALPIPWVEPIDISNALLFLVSDDARYITGVRLPVDAGAAVK